MRLAPARMDLIVPNKLLLHARKIRSEIIKPEARGFAVQTPKGSIIDLATEFGVEVADASCSTPRFAARYLLAIMLSIPRIVPFPTLSCLFVPPRTFPATAVGDRHLGNQGAASP